MAAAESLPAPEGGSKESRAREGDVWIAKYYLPISHFDLWLQTLLEMTVKISPKTLSNAL